LVSATILTLVLLPALYVAWFSPKKEPALDQQAGT
jgi:Cu/Ag efflux pump CusA